MKKYIFTIFLALTTLSVWAQSEKNFHVKKKPIGAILGAAIGPDTQLRLGMYGYNFYFAYSSNFKAIGPSQSIENPSGLEETSTNSINTFNFGYMIRLKNTSMFGIYLVPQIVYEQKSKLYTVKGTESPYIKGDLQDNMGFGVDLMFIDFSGFTVAVGGSTTAGFTAGLGYSF